MKLDTQVWVGTEKPEPHLITNLGDDMFWKPRGGMWTSTLDDEGGDWVRWLHDQGYDLDTPRWGGNLYALQPTDANLFVIGHPDGYNELAARFRHPLADSLLESKLGALKSMDRMIHWPEVAKHFDGIYVPNPRAFRFSMEDEYYAAGLFFDTCDAESTCWFRWCFEGDPELLDLKTLSVS